MVRHSRQHVRELADGVRESPRYPVPVLRDSAQGGHEHRHDADQRRAAADALHPAVRAGRLRRPMFHRLRHRRVAGRGGAAHRRRHLHEDRRHRLGPDEDRLQNQGRRCAQPRRDCRLHGRQCRRLGRPLGRRIRNLRRHRRRADLVHPARRVEPRCAGPAPGLDLHDAHRDGGRLRRLVSRQRGAGEEPVPRRRRR